MRAVRCIVRTRRRQLNRVCSEYREIPDVLVPHRDCPGIISVRLGAISELMPSKPVFRSRAEVEARGGVNTLPSKCQRTKELSDTKKQTSFICSADRDPLSIAVLSARMV